MIQQTQDMLRWLRQRWLIPATSAMALIIACTLVNLFVPRNIGYAYTDNANCIISPVVLPTLFHGDANGVFTLQRPAVLSAGHVPLFATKLCAAANKTPLANTAYATYEHIGFLSKRINITTQTYPVLSPVNLSSRPLALAKPLELQLSEPDATFSYVLVANQRKAPCTTSRTRLGCNLTPLKLNYGSNYSLSLARTFRHQTVGMLLTSHIETISAISITQTSISTGSTVYDTPNQLTITTSKPIATVGAVRISIKNSDGSSADVPTTNSFAGGTITVAFKAPPPRRANFDLHIDSITSNDTSGLEAPYDLTFTTSGGPKVTSVDIGQSGISFNPTIAVNFDQILASGQNFAAATSLLINGGSAVASISASGRVLYIRPLSALPVCARITIKLGSGLTSTYGISGDSAWTYNSRAQCYTTLSIGTTVHGRAITAYKFGAGESLVMYIGATHGNESNTAILLNRWINALKTNPDAIPAYRSIIVIPQINPDGVAANTRRNADDIDLNRNFPANNWRTSVTEPGGVTMNAGGPSPLSEPESKALATYVQSARPRFVLTYHSNANLVEANDAGDSDSLAAQYATKANYRAIPTYTIGNTFDYDTTGAFEDWMHDKLNLPAAVVELQSLTADEFTRNEAAMWFIAQNTGLNTPPL